MVCSILTTGGIDVVIGTITGMTVSEGEKNVIIGRDSGKDISSGDSNIAIGYELFISKTQERGPIGYRSGYKNRLSSK